MQQTKHFAAVLEQLPQMMEWISQCATQAGLSNKANKQLQLASEEALVNIFNYAYPKNAPNRGLELRSEADSGCLQLQIWDWGRAFNPLQAPPSELLFSLDRAQQGGFGILMMTHLCDQVAYQREGEANILSFTKTNHTPEKH